jgi:hypothetical protein
MGRHSSSFLPASIADAKGMAVCFRGQIKGSKVVLPHLSAHVLETARAFNLRVERFYIGQHTCVGSC